MQPPSSEHRLIVLLSVCCWSVVTGAPFLPSLSYPVFVFSPPPPPGQENRPADGTPQSSSGLPVISDLPSRSEVSQWHAQDELGRSVFGFESPQQARLEARASDGSVRGTYSYLDPNGEIVKMEYWDDGNGFQVRGNALPKETPEVAAARAQHMSIYRATLQALEHLPPTLSFGDSDEGSYLSSPGHHHFGGSVLSEPGRHHPYAEDTDTISLENPELYGDFNALGENGKEGDKVSGVSEAGGGGGGLEGEVELGEDVGPDEDEIQRYNSGEHETGKDVHYFKNNLKTNNNRNGDTAEMEPELNEGKSSLEEDHQEYKEVHDVPKKFFYHQTYQVPDDRSQEEEKGHQSVEHSAEVHLSSESDSHSVEEENQDRKESEEDQQVEKEIDSVVKHMDEHFDKVEHLLSREESDETSEEGEEISQRRHDAGGVDALAAENRKTNALLAHGYGSMDGSGRVLAGFGQMKGLDDVTDEGERIAGGSPLGRPAVVQPSTAQLHLRPTETADGGLYQNQDVHDQLHSSAGFGSSWNEQVLETKPEENLHYQPGNAETSSTDASRVTGHYKPFWLHQTADGAQDSQGRSDIYHQQVGDASSQPAGSHQPNWHHQTANAQKRFDSRSPSALYQHTRHHQTADAVAHPADAKHRRIPVVLVRPFAEVHDPQLAPHQLHTFYLPQEGS